MNIKDKVIEISKLLDELDEYDDTLYSSLTHEQDKVQDLLHLVEFNKLNTKQCYRVIRELHNVRNTRRKIKNDIELLRIFKEQKSKLSNKENRQFLLSDIGKTEKIQNSRTYCYRGYTEEEIKELIGEQTMEFKYKYALITKIKKKIETYFGNSMKGLEEYAVFRKFTEYKIFELKEVKGE